MPRIPAIKSYEVLKNPISNRKVKRSGMIGKVIRFYTEKAYADKVINKQKGKMKKNRNKKFMHLPEM